MKFEIKNRWSGNVQFTADITCAEDTPLRIKIGLALKWGHETGADLTGAVLRGAVLTGADLTGADLTGAVLRGADLTGAVLTGAVLTGADLRGAVLTGADLRGAVLTGADLRDAPVIRNIHQTVFAAASQPGALDMRDWHKCDTTHCRAGWVVALAGKEGRALEERMGTPAAASLIYLASDPKIERMPDFYCGDEEALVDMKALAEREASKSDV